MKAILLDAFGLKETFESTLNEDPDFQLLCRVINDQTTTDEDGHVFLKKGKEISPTSLQTPVEPEATYRYKSGQHHICYYDIRKNLTIKELGYEKIQI